MKPEDVPAEWVAAARRTLAARIGHKAVRHLFR